MKKQLITKKTNIGKILKKYPQTKEVFQKYGLHCIDCSLAEIETLEQGLESHMIDKKTIEEIIKEANIIIKK